MYPVLCMAFIETSFKVIERNKTIMLNMSNTCFSVLGGYPADVRLCEGCGGLMVSALVSGSSGRVRV